MMPRRMSDRPLKVMIGRAGTFPFWVHVNSYAEASRACLNFQTASGLLPADVTETHGAIIRDGAIVARVSFNGVVR